MSIVLLGEVSDGVLLCKFFQLHIQLGHTGSMKSVREGVFIPW